MTKTNRKPGDTWTTMDDCVDCGRTGGRFALKKLDKDGFLGVLFCEYCNAFQEISGPYDERLPSPPVFTGCASFNGADALYSRAYRLMEKHGADDCLINALDIGDEESIKACILRIHGNIVAGR